MRATLIFSITCVTHFALTIKLLTLNIIITKLNGSKDTPYFPNDNHALTENPEVPEEPRNYLTP